MNDREILKAVNPSYMTGKGCLMMLMATGEPDAVKLGGSVDLSDIMGLAAEHRNDPILNCSANVKDIFEVTGFDSMIVID